MQVVLTETNVAARSAAVAASYAALDVIALKDTKNYNMLYAQRIMLSAASEFIAGSFVDPIAANAIRGTAGDALQVAVDPVISGAIYAFAAGPLKLDGRSWQRKFMHQAGASVAGGYIEQPIKGMLGM